MYESPLASASANYRTITRQAGLKNGAGTASSRILSVARFTGTSRPIRVKLRNGLKIFRWTRFLVFRISVPDADTFHSGALGHSGAVGLDPPIDHPTPAMGTFSTFASYRRAMELAQRDRSPQGYGCAHAAAQIGAWRF